MIEVQISFRCNTCPTTWAPHVQSVTEVKGFPVEVRNLINNPPPGWVCQEKKTLCPLCAVRDKQRVMVAPASALHALPSKH